MIRNDALLEKLIEKFVDENPQCAGCGQREYLYRGGLCATCRILTGRAKAATA